MTQNQISAQQKAAQVRIMIFDVDGVLTDGSMQYSAEGELIKRFFVHDGLGIQLLQKMGITTAIISARQTPIVNKRAADLGITYVYQGNHDKRITFAQLLNDTGVAAHECGFMGDDIVDLPLFAKVGFAVSVPNAHPEASSRADYITKAAGGLGAVREICDFILRAQNKYDAALAPYLA
ncbi:KdsC family phosphatase [Solimicrobium silvestre]|uniref:3-deoxy-D-manno-octulosonate 8-phosphate phosphatase KdsC n=1 Tax=Solimicrobium silvestre TaxID=2099400 RepID=A0A2S9H479_9BURK|nr:HAD family hydrolase [Solimicrobium silvestre]PRC94795.1 YrbI-phosphatas: 3-deoxy-D-manno-octulosonate 8-phosphate phosphatase, YrbI family [Solimicrobium silvestre]